MALVGSASVEMLIGGRWEVASGGGTFEREEPCGERQTTVIAAATAEDVQRACDTAAAAFESWSLTSPGARRELLNKAADNIAERAPQVATTMTSEIGGTFAWGMFNCSLASRMLQEAAAQTYAITGEVIPSDVPGSLSMGVRQPAGVVVGMAPWNAPVILATRAIAMPLACGNAVVLKASENCPRTHAAVVAAIADAGFPPGVVNFVTHAPDDAPEVVSALIEHPAVRRVNFTGSTHVGRIIAMKCAEHLKPCLLELGGKAPQLVLADADLDAATAAACFGAFMNAGQICMSTEKIVADRTIVAELGDRLAGRAADLATGDPTDQATLVGPVIDDSARARVMDLIEDARAKGATILAGGTADGNVISPTVIMDVTPDMRIYAEESFGPVVAIVPVEDDDGAVRVANDTEYGLAASVFSEDVDRAMAIARRIESGICHINSATVHDQPQVPFGGVKASGWGRFGGRAAVDEFTDLRWMTIQQAPRHYPI